MSDVEDEQDVGPQNLTEALSAPGYAGRLLPAQFVEVLVEYMEVRGLAGLGPQSR